MSECYLFRLVSVWPGNTYSLVGSSEIIKHYHWAGDMYNLRAGRQDVRVTCQQPQTALKVSWIGAIGLESLSWCVLILLSAPDRWVACWLMPDKQASHSVALANVGIRSIVKACQWPWFLTVGRKWAVFLDEDQQIECCDSWPCIAT